MPSSGTPGRDPLWATVLADLRDRLAAREFDDRFPTDRELMDRYRVSRHTVREAVRRLGVVERRPRLGGRVRAPATGALPALGRTLAALGVRLELLPGPHSGDPREGGPTGPDTAHGQGAATAARHLLRADGLPLADSHCRVEGPGPPAAELAPGLLGLGAPPVALRPGPESVLPDVPPAAVREALELGEGIAVYRVDTTHTLDDGSTVTHRAYVRADRYPCILRFTPG
ncbi:GntR family transcriptional regulator [Pseudonocardia sp. NPDC046786]|uniref:GntR family transcriptional regulator n=1 Tax=Pseudonocardia sp. NPDC046786 TaxID=3155471 RepID=UPI00340E0F68